MFMRNNPTTIVSCSEDGGLYMWDFNKRNEDQTQVRFSSDQLDNVEAVKIHDDVLPLNCLAMEPDYGWLAASGDSEAVHFVEYRQQ
jgi:WD40 repeat protein